MDFFNKEVIFRQLGLPMVVFYRKWGDITLGLISAFFTHHLHCKGCLGHLAHMYDTKTCKVRLENIPVTWDFLNVFSNELLGLPLGKEIEFTIDLVLRTHPISLPFYRMAPAELKELKTQL